MLPHAGSNASSNNLRRSKSSTSVKDRRKHPLLSEPLDPETSRLHALIAAHKAMDRSYGSGSPKHVRTDSKTTQRSDPQRIAQSVYFSPESGVRSKPLRQQTTMSPVNTRSSTAEYTRDDTFSYEDSLIPLDFGGMGESYGAQPSSYRRLGRAKSMLMTGRRSRQFLSSTASETSFSQAPTLRNAVSSMSLREPGLRLRLKRSLSILRPTDRRTIAPNQLQLQHTYRPESIVLARQQFLDGTSQLQVKRKVSQLFQSRTNREQKAFRQTLRPDLSNGPVALDKTPLDLPISSARKKDSISNLLRSRFMKSFSKRRDDPETFPPQQLSATRDYFGAYAAGSNVEAGFDSYHEADISSQRRNSLYVPSNPHPETCEDVESLSQKLRTSASFESLRSNSKSRVTSWTNSTNTNSSRVAVYENNRLSIIKEDGGPHHPSCSAGRHMGGVTAFHQPMPAYEGNQIDSRRVYSALVKRIDQEQAEMDRTQISLAKIHEEEEHGRISHDKFPECTIRTVESRASSAVPDDSLEDTHSHRSFSRTMEERSHDGASIHGVNAGSSGKHVQQREAQSSFFPFSKETKPQNPSPFRKVLMERRHQRSVASHQDTANDDSSVIVRRKGRGLNCSKFGQSTESVYSRNTDGGTNADYISPVGSTDDFMPNPLQGYQDTGMATIMYSNHIEPNARISTSLSAAASEKTNWRVWVENQMANFTRHGSKTSNHVRENAYVESVGLDAVRNRGSENNMTVLSEGRSIAFDRIGPPSADTTGPQPDNSTWGQAMYKTHNTDREPDHVFSSSSRMDSTLRLGPEQCLQVDRRDTSEPSQPAQKHEAKINTLRKISPSNVVKILKSRKSQPVLSSHPYIGKENKPGSGTVSTPVSTPGRLQLQMRSGNSTGRLRERVDSSGFGKSRTKVSTTDGSENAVDESPSDRFKNALSARLSRPFDMDVPESNRPFDSMYLGKRTPGFAEALRGDRLSIAPKVHQLRLHKSYGGLGPPPLFGVKADHTIDEAEATALPAIPDANNTEKRSASLSNIATTSKRMVSNFLKSRRKSSDQDDGDVTSLGSAAFL